MQTGGQGAGNGVQNMEQLAFSPGEILFRKGEPVKYLLLISQGSVIGSSEKGDIFLGKGDVPGLFDFFHGYSFYTYTASDATTVIKYDVSSPEELKEKLRTADLSSLMAISICKQICEILDDSILQTYNCNSFYQGIQNFYSNYTILCAQNGVTPKTLQGAEELAPFQAADIIPDYLSAYYETIRDISPETRNALFHDHPDFTYGFIAKASEDIHKVHEYLGLLADYQNDYAYILLNSSENDLFDLYTSLCIQLAKKHADTMSLGAEISKIVIQMEGQPSIDRALYQKRIASYRQEIEKAMNSPVIEETSEASSILENSAAEIMEYSDYPGEKREDFLQDLEDYIALSDKASTEDYAISLRKRLTLAFYEMYTPAFQYSMKDRNIPASVKLFLLFGFIDEKLAGKENTADMLSVCDDLINLNHSSVFTFYGWLKAIYEGKKDPSRNEFETDYVQYLHELKVANKISPEMEKKMYRDPAGRVMYELQNMFPSVNKITTGRISAFCPFFSDNNCIHKPSESLATVEKIREAIAFIRNVDFKAFYRDNLFTLPEAGINHDNVQLEVIPNIILMPNVGVRGALWQEIEGRKRTTPARMMLPILCQEEIRTLIARMTGEFRWEMCKRVQGARWNDVSDPSLTSEYFDYIQFYRKNNELSPDTKEKIKTALQRAKNSYREMFVRDYLQWIFYEGAGSPRLNRVVRKIMFKYCPFPKGIREKLGANPMYKSEIDYFKLHNGQDIHRLEGVIKKIQNCGLPVPEEISRQMDFLKK